MLEAQCLHLTLIRHRSRHIRKILLLCKVTFPQLTVMIRSILSRLHARPICWKHLYIVHSRSLLLSKSRKGFVHKPSDGGCQMNCTSCTTLIATGRSQHMWTCTMLLLAKHQHPNEWALFLNLVMLSDFLRWSFNRCRQACECGASSVCVVCTCSKVESRFQTHALKAAPRVNGILVK